MAFEYKVKVNEVEYILPNPKEVQVSHKNKIETDSTASSEAEVVSDNKLAPTTCVIELHGSDLVAVAQSSLTTGALSTVRSMVDTFEKWKNDKQRMVIYTRYRNLYNMVIESIDIEENSDDHTGAMVAVSFVESSKHRYNTPSPVSSAGGNTRKKIKNTGTGGVDPYGLKTKGPDYYPGFKGINPKNISYNAIM